ncbi:hypothetical protein ACLOJK_032634 [Asimina triloba]
MIAAVCWIPKGVSKIVPVVVEPPSKEEIEDILKKGDLRRSGDSEDEDDEEMDVDAVEKIDEISQALAAADALGKKSGSNFEEITDGLKELNMDNYDEEDAGIELFSTGLGDAYYPTNDMDPYLKDKDDDDDEEIEDMTIKPSDAVIVCARNEDDVSHLEACDGGSIFYLFGYMKNHEMMVAGNFIAVGSMEPAIEIWDLDLIDEVQPHIVLGGISEKKKKGKKFRASVKYKKDSHKDSVLGLAWNKEIRNVLASASADKTVKNGNTIEFGWEAGMHYEMVILYLAVEKCRHEQDEHETTTVQSVAWNCHVPELLLSGSFDHSVVMRYQFTSVPLVSMNHHLLEILENYQGAVFNRARQMDMKAPSQSRAKWSVTADVESLAWDPHNEHFFVVSLENGTVQGFDTRTVSNSSSASKPSFTLHAHDKAVCTVSYNPSAANGAVFSVSFSDDSPFLLAIGGSKGRLQVRIPCQPFFVPFPSIFPPTFGLIIDIWEVYLCRRFGTHYQIQELLGDSGAPAVKEWTPSQKLKEMTS